MSEALKTRYCGYCKVRHPIDDFTGAQYVCKWGRLQEQQENARKNTENPKSPDYEKYCRKCGQTKPAKDNFMIDRSRPDGFFLYCKDCESISPRVHKLRAFVGMPGEFRKKLLRTIFRTIKDSDRSIARQLIEDFRHEKEKISFTGREWQIQILNDLRPNVVVRKPSQKGLTWVLERFVIALLMRYEEKPYRYKDHTGVERSRFLEGIYSFETSDKASKWSKVRLKKIKDDNPHIRDALKVGETDSALLMKFGRTALHLVGRATVSSVLTISGDIVVIDEKDRDADPSVSSQIGSRTLESEFMNTASTKGITRETSTPEVSSAGISLQYESSDQAEWAIICTKCGVEQVLAYPDCIGNFYEKGETPLKDPETGKELVPYWRCMHCHEPIDWVEIGKWTSEDPDHYENCRWIVQKPENYNPKTGKGIGGYQVPFASPQRPAAFFLAERDDPEHDLPYLYNHMLGLPYDDITKTLVRDNFHVKPDYEWGFSRGDRYVIGCDHHPNQGGFIVICRQIKASVTPTKPEGKWVIVYTEHVENNRDLWDNTETISDINVIKKGRLYELITEFNADLCVVDVEPDTNEVEKLIIEFAFSKQVWSCRSGRYNDSFTWVENEIIQEKEIPVCRIQEDKVAAIDWYFNKIRFGDMMFLEPEKYMGKWQSFMDSHTNLYKGEVHARAGVGEKLAAQNINEVYKMRQNKIKDHWTMAGKFCAQGIRLITKIKLNKKHIAPPMIRGFKRIQGM